MLFVLISSSQEQGWPMKGLSPYPCPRRCRISSPRVLGIGASVLPGEYRVYARFHAFIDILTEAGIVGITDQADQAGPSTIILSPDLPSDWVSTVQSVSITETTLSLDSLVLPIEGAQRYRETLQLPELPVPIDLQPALMLFQKILLSKPQKKVWRLSSIIRVQLPFPATLTGSCSNIFLMEPKPVGVRSMDRLLPRCSEAAMD